MDLTINGEFVALQSGGGVDTRKNELARADKAVSLQFLLELGLPARDVRSLAGQYLDLPVYPDMCPYYFVYRAGKLIRNLPDEVLPAHTEEASSAPHDKQLVGDLIDLLTPELEAPFSFLE